MKVTSYLIMLALISYGCSVLALGLVNKSGQQVTVYYAGSNLCRGYASRKITYLAWNNQSKEMNIKDVCDSMQLGNNSYHYFWGGTGGDSGNGTVYVLYYFDVNTNSPLSIPRLYQLGNPISDKTYVFNPRDPRAKENPVAVKNGKALTVQFPDPNIVKQAGGFFLD